MTGARDGNGDKQVREEQGDSQVALQNMTPNPFDSFILAPKTGSKDVELCHGFQFPVLP